jgi:hypothetical protein
MKKILSFLLQSLFFVFCCVAGSFLRPFHLQQVTRISPTITHVFVWDGFLLMLLAYALLVAIEAGTKRLRTAVPCTTIALAVATALSVAIKLGRITHDL